MQKLVEPMEMAVEQWQAVEEHLLEQQKNQQACVTHSSLIGPILVGHVDDDKTVMMMMMMMMFLLHRQLFAVSENAEAPVVDCLLCGSASHPAQSHSNGYFAADCSTSARLHCYTAPSPITLLAPWLT